MAKNTLYQRIRIFLYRYNTFWLEFGIQAIAALVFILSLGFLNWLPNDNGIGRFAFRFTFSLALFVFGLVGWVRIIKGERATRYEIIRSKFALYSGIAYVIIFWGFACFILFTFFQPAT